MAAKKRKLSKRQFNLKVVSIRKGLKNSKRRMAILDKRWDKLENELKILLRKHNKFSNKYSKKAKHRKSR